MDTVLSKTDFLIYLLDKLNTSDASLPVSGILEELCDYLHFGCGFCYHVDHDGVFHLSDSYSLFEVDGFPLQIDFSKEIGDRFFEILKESREISFREETCSTPLMCSLATLFQTKSLLLVPIVDEQSNFFSFIGIADRRGAARTEDEDMAFAYSVLSTLANHIKIQFYRYQLESTRRALSNIMDNMGVDIYVNDFHTHEILYANQSMAAPYGDVESMIGKICWQYLYDGKTEECDFCPRKNLIDEFGNPTHQVYSWDYQRPFDGSWFRVLSAVFDWVDGRPAQIVSSVDITENKRNEEMIRQIASYDNLTGLPNRYKLSRDSDEMLPDMKRQGVEGYLLFFDLDGFKKVNDTLGHEAGDELLKKIGEMLQGNPLTRDNVYRYGGDEFVILHVREGGDNKELQAMIGFLRESFARPFELSAGTVNCNASIGISHYPYDDDKTAELIRKADQAMYVSKGNDGERVHFYNRGKICSFDEYLQKSR